MSQQFIRNEFENEMNRTMYNGYNFTSFKMWDNFWFSDKTDLLMQTVEYTVGKEEIILPTIRISPSKYIFVDQNVTMPIFGLPY